MRPACLLASIAALVVASHLSAQAAGTDTVPTGVWGAVHLIGPALTGPVEVAQAPGGSWSATIAGRTASGTARRGRLTFDFPGGQGQLDIEAPRAGQPVRGYWRQAGGAIGRQVATPVTLAPTASGFAGLLAPLEDRFTLYLTIQSTDSGARGVFHNPEAGWNGGRSWFRVRRAGSTLEFLDPVSGKVRQQQPWNPATGAVTMDFGTTFDLVPMSLDQARGLVPRPPSAAPYTYRVPAPDTDGWTAAPAASTGQDEALLTDLVRHVAATDALDPQAPRIHAILVAHRGTLVLEEYFAGYSRERPHDIRSAGKTFTGLMAGIAIDRGLLTTESPVYATIGAAPPDTDPRRGRLQLRHLLSHSPGFACDDNDEDSPGQEDKMYEQQRQPDWYRYTLDLPMAREPGSAWFYCTAGVNLAGAMIAAAARVSVLDFWRDHVADPLQMRHWHMPLMPSGDAFSGGGAWLRPRDLLKLGQVFLDGGTWNGRRIVSEAWVRQSTRPVIVTADSTEDGLGWHLKSVEAGGRTWRMYYASGNGGQLVMVVPELELVVGFTAGNFNRYPIWRRFRDDLLPRYIIPSVREAGARTPPTTKPTAP